VLEQEYLTPESIAEAVELLDKHGKEAKILAGGTDLVIGLRENIISCKYLVDIKKIPKMRELKYSEDTGLSIGGAVTLNEIIASQEVQENYPILVEAGKLLANYLLRNRATMMGNLCNASPAGDMLTPALVLDGIIETVSKQGLRRIPLKDFFLGVKRTVLKENELAVRIIFPSLKGKGKFLRRSRIKGHDLAQIGIAGFLKNDGGLKLALGAVAPVPVLIDEFTNISKYAVRNEKIKAEIVDKVMNSINPIGDQRASREYRLAMAKYLTEQVLESLAKEV
jgi:CO/xanthine dehydrogenase FAD-binding subunit